VIVIWLCAIATCTTAPTQQADIDRLKRHLQTEMEELKLQLDDEQRQHRRAGVSCCDRMCTPSHVPGRSERMREAAAADVAATEKELKEEVRVEVRAL
jgi:hypothetical protein